MRDEVGFICGIVWLDDRHQFEFSMLNEIYNKKLIDERDFLQILLTECRTSIKNVRYREITINIVVYKYRNRTSVFHFFRRWWKLVFQLNRYVNKIVARRTRTWVLSNNVTHETSLLNQGCHWALFVGNSLWYDRTNQLLARWLHVTCLSFVRNKWKQPLNSISQLAAARGKQSICLKSCSQEVDFNVK